MLNAERSTFLEITFRETYIKEASTAMALVFDCEVSVFKGKKSIDLFEDPSVHIVQSVATTHQSPSPSDRCRLLHTVLCITQGMLKWAKRDTH